MAGGSKMDPRVRFDDTTEVLESVGDDVQSRIRTVIPVAVSVDSDGHTVSLQPLTMLTRRKSDGTVERVALPVISDGPIQHAGGGGITTTHAHKKDDEGLLLVADRALDAWFQNGGQQGAVDARMHSLSDGVYVPGVRNMPRKLQGVSTTSTQTRTDDKQTVHDVSHSAVTSVREDSAHQVNGMAIQTEKGGSKIHVDASTIVKVSPKILLNC